MSSFGRLFRVSTFGESHCKGVGCIVEGVPPRMALTEADVQPQLSRRRPGQSHLTTKRDESDTVTIMSGTEVTKGEANTPSLLIPSFLVVLLICLSRAESCSVATHWARPSRCLCPIKISDPMITLRWPMCHARLMLTTPIK